ncbi:MAG: DUF5618 family protein [Nitrospirae bacterium]|nr:DUF5618 family protein [Nitrospirota bacterium]
MESVELSMGSMRQSKSHTAGEALRYMENSRGLLKAAAIEDNIYLDKKPVREAFGTAYLAILEALDEALIKKGLTRKELPKSVAGYMAAIKKHLSINNGKLVREFDDLYETLHIAGYYRGLFGNANIVKEAMKEADAFIKKILQ